MSKREAESILAGLMADYIAMPEREIVRQCGVCSIFPSMGKSGTRYVIEMIVNQNDQVGCGIHIKGSINETDLPFLEPITDEYLIETES